MTAGTYLKIIVIGVSASLAIAAIAIPARSLPTPVAQMDRQAMPISVGYMSHAPHDVSAHSVLTYQSVGTERLLSLTSDRARPKAA